VRVDFDPELIIGLGSAVLAVISAIAAGIMANRSARQAHDLERQRRQETQAEAAERILHQYRDPLLDAANTLQGRLYNVVGDNYFGRYLHCGDPDEERYARYYTVFAIAEYLCWVEIVRRELRFLDLGDIKRNRKLLEQLRQTEHTFQSDKLRSPFRVFRGRQRAIAELMMVPTNAADGPRSECVGYAAFSRRLESDSEFAGWFASLSADVDVVARSSPAENIRLYRLQRDLIDLIDFLDPDSIRVPAQFRNKVAEPALPAAPAPVRS
jgi:hypothetical protein